MLQLTSNKVNPTAAAVRTKEERVNQSIVYALEKVNCAGGFAPQFDKWPFWNARVATNLTMRLGAALPSVNLV